MARLKSCSSCGRIHADTFICDKRKARIKAYKQQQSEKIEGKKDLRFTSRWRKKANEIKQRDSWLCQMCTRSIDMLSDMKIYNYLNIQVHHIIKIVDDKDKAFDNDNLITLCRYHHELVENKKDYIKKLKTIAYEQENKNK